ncbi:MAG: hypothetical protein J5856_08515 [Lachnospiraceae bacterium]|nr:hypothetical protein [Lachnospiraceae bacterium]
MIPDLYSFDIITYDIEKYNHEINSSNHTESLVFTAISDNDSKDFDDVDPREEIEFYMLKDVPQDSIGLSLLDLGSSDDCKTLDAFEYIEKAIDCLSFLDLSLKKRKADNNLIFYIPFDAKILDKIEEISCNVLNYLEKAVSLKPELVYIYPFFQLTLNQLWVINKNTKKRQGEVTFADKSYTTLVKEISNFKENYYQGREAIYSIFMRPEQLKIIVSPNDAFELYKSYASLKNIQLFNLHRTGESDEKKEYKNWEEFLLDKHGLSVNEIYGYCFPTFKKIILGVLNSLANSNTTVRQCTLCGGYFKTKWNSKQTCCARIYRDTKTTCYEYASRKAYKEKQKEHPVYQEYIKAYNRLYGRIRRKTVSPDTLIADKLIELRNEYYKIYDESDSKRQKEIIEELSQKFDEILAKK